MALHHIYATAHDESKKFQRSIVNIQLSVVHDYVKMYSPWINKDIVYFGIPQRFKFTRVAGIAIMQYMNLSPAVAWMEGKSWMPKPPLGFIVTPENVINTQANIPLCQFTTIGGENVILKEYNVEVNSEGPKKKKTSISTMHKTRELSESLPDFFDLEVSAIAEQMKRIDIEAAQGVIDERFTPDDDVMAAIAQDMLVRILITLINEFLIYFSINCYLH